MKKKGCRKKKHSIKKNPHLDVDALDDHLPRLQQNLLHDADLALVGPGDHLHGVPRADVDGLEHGLAVGRQRRVFPLFAGTLMFF